MKEEELKEKVWKLLRSRMDSYDTSGYDNDDIEAVVELVFQEGRQSKLKEVLNILERYDYLNNGFIIEIKEQISKELSGVNHSQETKLDEIHRKTDLQPLNSEFDKLNKTPDTRKGLCKWECIDCRKIYTGKIKPKACLFCLGIMKKFEVGE